MSIDKEYLREDEEEVRAIEKLALDRPPSIPDHCLPTKEYLIKFVLPHLEAAMKATAQERPKNPIEFFSYYLLAQRNK